MKTEQTTASDFHPSALADIYQADVNIAVWQRQLDSSIIQYANYLVNKKPRWQAQFIQKQKNMAPQLERELPLSKHRKAFIDDVALVTDMFSCLFELDNIGLRLSVLHAAMCPKFHFDRVPCRLISTYTGAGTEWHTPGHVQRCENNTVTPLPGINPNMLDTGDVALLKGESWEGNEGRGLVHRSPAASQSAPRLVLTLDFA